MFTTSSRNTLANNGLTKEGKYITLGGEITGSSEIFLTNDSALSIEGFNINKKSILLGSGFNGFITKILSYDAGRVLVSGNFSTFNDTPVNNLGRVLYESGELDQTFRANSFEDVASSDFDIFGDGKLIAVFDQTIILGISPNQKIYSTLIKLNADGTVDTSFNGTINGLDNAPNFVKVLGDDKFIVYGSFTSYSGVTVNVFIQRFNNDGTIDTTFNAGFGGIDAGSLIYSIAIQSDDKIVAVGDIQSYDGNSFGQIMRLNADGTFDGTFTSGTGFDSIPDNIQVFSDDALLVRGSFTDYDGTPVDGFVKLNSDGTIDSTFLANLSGLTVNSFKIDDQDRILVVSVNVVRRLNSDGTIDTSFAPRSSAGINAIEVIGSDTNIFAGNVSIYDLIPQSNFVVTDYTGSSLTASANVVVDTPIQSPSSPTNSNSLVTKESVGGLIEGSNGITKTTYENIQPQTSLELGGTLSKDTELISETSLRIVGNGIVIGGIESDDLRLEYNKKFSASNAVNSITILNSDIYAAGLGGLFHKYDSTGKRDDNFFGNGRTNSLSINNIAHDGTNLYLGGQFTIYDDKLKTRIVKVTPTGAISSTFDVGFGFNAPVNKITYVPSIDKFYVAGLYTQFNNVSQARLVRLNSDGSKDTTFSGLTSGFGSTVFDFQVQGDGKIIVGGQFTTYNGGSQNRLVRLNTNGSKDTGFNIGTGFAGGIATVRTIAIQTGDSKVIVGGSFSTFTGTTQSRIIRLNSNGTKDGTFTIGTGFDNTVNSVLVQPDGKILVGGAFTSYSGISVNRIVRLNSNGTLDSSFNNLSPYGLSGNVFNIYLQSDGKIIVGGSMSLYSGQTVANLVRLNSDGTLEDDEYSNKMLVNNGALEYSQDNSANFNDRSIVDKGYVDALVVSGVTSGVTANNGLTKTGANIYLGGLITGSTEIVYTAGTTTNTVALGSNNALYVTADDTPLGAYSELRVRPQDVSIYSDDANGVLSSNITTNSSSNRMNSTNQDINSYAEFVTQTPVNNVPEARIFVLDGNTFSNNIAQFQPSGFTFTVQDPYNEDTSVFKLMSGTTTLYAKHGINLNGVNSELELKSDSSKFAYTDDSVISNTSKIGEFNDAYFSGDKGFDLDVREIALQPDGKMIVLGSFTSYGTTPAPSLIRLNTDGTVDPTFSGVTLGFNTVTFRPYVIVQPDGKLIIGDAFTSYNGVSANRIIRLNADGSRDESFSGLTTGFNAAVLGVKLQTDNKILVTGDFTSYNGVAQNRIIRLNPDGSKDTTFSGVTTGFNNTSYDILYQSGDSKIVVVGNFTQYNGVSRPRIVRLNPNGSYDTTFSGVTTGFNNFTYSIERQSTGKYVASGSFASYNGTAAQGVTRLNANGSKDTSFTGFTTGFNFSTSAYEVKADASDKLVLVGNFSTYNGTTANRLVRLTANGAYDTSFSGNTLGFNNELATIAIQSDGKIIVGGRALSYNNDISYKIFRLNTNGTNDGTFTQNSFGFNGGVETIKKFDDKYFAVGQFTNYGGTLINRIAKLNSDFTFDTSFTGVTTGFDNTATRVLKQTTNKYIVTGSFLNFNGVSRNRIVRLTPNGAFDTTFTGLTSGFNNTIREAILQTDDKILVTGNFTSYNGTTRNRLVRLTADGAFDPTFSGFTTGLNSQGRAVAVQPNGKIIVVGNFTTYNGVSQVRIVRLNTDGSKDTSFSGYTSGFDSEAYAVSIQPDGKILVAGDFDSYNGVNTNKVVRLTTDGYIDPTFSGLTLGSGFDSGIEKLYLQPNGKMFVSGFFEEFDGSPVNYFVRLNSDGSLDTSFNAGPQFSFADLVYGMLDLGDGTLFLNGYNASYKGNTVGFVTAISDYVDLVVKNNYSMKYADDYSNNFTDRSLVDKAYVDNHVSGSSATANNGLTKIGNNIRLGGSLTGNTTISGAFDLALNGVKAFEIDIVDGTDTPYAYINSNGIDLGAADNTFTDLGALSLQKSYISMGVTSAAGGITGEMMITPTPQFRFAASGGLASTFRGLTYFADYSSNFGVRSLVDKGYVTGLTSQNSKSSFSITGNNVTTTFTVTHNKNTRDVIVQVYEGASPYGTVIVDTERTTVNAVDVKFNVAPGTGIVYRIVII